MKKHIVNIICKECHHSMNLHGPIGCYEPDVNSPLDTYGQPVKFCDCMEMGTYGVTKWSKY